MRVKWATICRYAEHTSEGPILIGAGAEVILQDPPERKHTIYVAGCLTDFGDTPKATWVKLTVYRPNGDVLFTNDRSAFFERRIGVEHVPHSSEEYFYFVYQVEWPSNETGMFAIGVKGDLDEEDYLMYVTVLSRNPDVRIEKPSRLPTDPILEPPTDRTEGSDGG